MPFDKRYPGPPRDPHPPAVAGGGSAVGCVDTIGIGGAETMGAGGFFSLFQLAHLPFGKRYPGPPREPHPSAAGDFGSTLGGAETKFACGFCKLQE